MITGAFPKACLTPTKATGLGLGWEPGKLGTVMRDKKSAQEGGVGLRLWGLNLCSDFFCKVEGRSCLLSDLRRESEEGLFTFHVKRVTACP